MGSFVQNRAEKGANDTIELHVRRVTDELKDTPPGWKQRVALVKIDVEGF